jgi:hypothetical protein
VETGIKGSESKTGPTNTGKKTEGICGGEDLPLL